MHPGQHAEIRVDSFPKLKIKGHVDSISSAITILGAAGPLTNATACGVNVAGYNLNNNVGEHAWWAKCENGCPIGGMTVSNSVVPDFQNDSGTFAFNFISNTVLASVQSSVAGAAFSVDGTVYTNANTFNWLSGSSHTLAAANTQSGGAGTQFIWSAWSDGSSVTHIVNPAISTNYNAVFTAQYYLTMSTGLGGSISPVSLWTNSGAVVMISATPSNGYAFSDWTGAGNESYSGSSNSAAVVMNGAVAENATYLPPAQSITGFSVSASNGISVTFGTEPGFSYHVEETTNLASPSWAVLSGSVTSAASNSVTFSDTNSIPGPLRFYRTVSP